jgi:hypothetical protein
MTRVDTMIRTTVTLTLAALLLLGATTTASAEEECIDLGGAGAACHELGEDAGAVTLDAEAEGISVSASVTYSIG